MLLHLQNGHDKDNKGIWGHSTISPWRCFKVTNFLRKAAIWQQVLLYVALHRTRSAYFNTWLATLFAHTGSILHEEGWRFVEFHMRSKLWGHAVLTNKY